MKVLITGATGMVGKGVLYICLEDEDVDQVVSISRSSTGISHPKLKEVIHNDFFNLDAIKDAFTDIDACFFCLGVSAVGLKEPVYFNLTHTLTTGFAQTLLSQSPNAQFCYVSGAGTDSSETGRMMWARVKGKTENDIMKMGFKASWMYRPGFIQPMRNIKSKVGWYQFFYNVLKPFYGLLQKMPKYVTDTDVMGRSMLHVCRKGYKSQILESLDINSTGKLPTNPA